MFSCGFSLIFLLITSVVGRNQAILLSSGYICYTCFQGTLFEVLGVSWREVTWVKVKQTNLKKKHSYDQLGEFHDHIDPFALRKRPQRYPFSIVTLSRQGCSRRIFEHGFDVNLFCFK